MWLGVREEAEQHREAERHQMEAQILAPDPRWLLVVCVCVINPDGTHWVRDVPGQICALTSVPKRNSVCVRSSSLPPDFPNLCEFAETEQSD